MAKVKYGGGRFVFFTDPAIEKAVDKSVALALSKWGAYVRRSARQSIKKRKKPSLPGNPPHSHEGSLKRLLNFYFDKVTKTVVVGPEIKSNSSGAPNTLEFGGASVKSPKNVDRKFKVGDFGPIRAVQDATGREVFVWTRLKSGKQCRRASELYKRYIVSKWRVIKVAPRPYMNPAMMKNLHVAPYCFKASLRG